MNEDAYKKNNRPEKGGMPGVYTHPFVNDELHATSFPQADALIRQGWVYDRELPKASELAKVNAVAPTAVSDLAAAQARVAELESLVASGKAQVKENAKTENEENKQAAKDTLDREQARKEQEAARTKSDEKVAEANKTLNEQKGKN
jgi:hypothetical protein